MRPTLRVYETKATIGDVFPGLRYPAVAVVTDVRDKDSGILVSTATDCSEAYYFRSDGLGRGSWQPMKPICSTIWLC
jgi:hypothetical protein